MNNLEKIKNLTLVQMIDFIDRIDVCNKIADNAYCNFVCPYRKSVTKGCDFENDPPCVEISDKDCIKAWLEADTPIPQ